MDPISITTATATIIKLASSASLTLYSFIRETQNVDQNVKDLATEVDGLKCTLIEVDSVFKQPRITSAKERMFKNDGKQLWNTLSGCLEESQIAVVRLDSALNGIRSKASSWTKQALRQVKLNLRMDEINSLRIQIRTHCITLSTALQMVNIRATYLVPEAVIDDLGPRIDTLQKSLDFMMVSLQDMKSDASRVPENAVHFEPSSMQKLHSLGKRILAEATTVYESSVGRESEYGDQITSDTALRTMNWIPEPTIYSRTPSLSSMTPTTRYQPTPSTTDSIIDVQGSQSDLPSVEANLVDSDSETEFELEIAQGLLKRGKEIFASEKYESAVGYLQKGIAAFNRLPYNWKSRLDPVEIPLMIATCKFHLGEIDEASRHLLLLAQKESSGDQDAIRKCQISYLLSQIYVIKNNISAAEQHCRNSLKGRRRLLGKFHRDYLASVSLLSEIYSACGKCEEAEVLKDMLPPEHQQNPDITRLRTLISDRTRLHSSAMNTREIELSDRYNDLTSQPVQRATNQSVQARRSDTSSRSNDSSPSTGRSSGFLSQYMALTRGRRVEYH